MTSDEEHYKGYSVVSLPNKMKDKKDAASSGLLEDVALHLIVLTQSCVEKMTYLPFPMGNIVEAVVEGMVVPLVRPIEGFTLRFLAALDDQIYAVGTSVEGCVLCTSGKLNSVLAVLRKRGPIGLSADVWLQHEAVVKEKMQSMIDFANKIPLFGLITPFVCTVSEPFANAISSWLVEHSQSQEKRIESRHKVITSGKEGLDELEAKPGDQSSTPPPHTTEIVEAEDVKEEEERKLIDATLKKDVGAGKAKKGAQEYKLGKATHNEKENDANDVSVVLEMIDSGWHLGSSVATSPKASVAAVPKTSAAAVPKNPSNPKKPANPKSRRGIFKRN